MPICLALPGAYGLADTIKQQCQGKLTTGFTFVPIGYDNRGIDGWRISQGVEMLDQALIDFNGQNINIVGHGMGASVINLWAYRYGINNPFDPSKLNFYNFGDPSHRYGGIYYDPMNAPPVNTPYKIRVLTRQYDGYADAVHDKTNQDATKNQWYGAQYLNPDYYDFNPDPDAAGNVKFVEGNITYVWQRENILPMVQTQSQVYRFFGIASTPNYSDAAKDKDRQLRPSVEAAFNRPVSIPNPFWW